MSEHSRTASNYVLQIISLAKHAKLEAKKGDFRHAQRILNQMLTIDKKEIKVLRYESASKDLVDEATHILSLVKEAKDHQEKIAPLLDRILDLEEHDFLVKVKRFEDIKAKIAKERVYIDRISDRLGKRLDKMIKPLVATFMYLGYQTTQSCHGHKNWGTSYPWVEFQTEKNLSLLNNVLREYNHKKEIFWSIKEFSMQDSVGILLKKRDREMNKGEFNKVMKEAKNALKEYGDKFHLYSHDSWIVYVLIKNSRSDPDLSKVAKVLREKLPSQFEVNLSEPTKQAPKYRLEAQGGSLKHMQQDIIHLSDYLLKVLGN